MFKRKLTTWQKLFIGLLMVALIPMLIAGNVAVRLLDTGVEQQAELALSSDLNAASRILYSRLDNMESYLLFLSRHDEIREMVSKSELQDAAQHDLHDRLFVLKNYFDLSFLTLVGTDGTILCSANAADLCGYEIEEEVFVELASREAQTKGFTVLGEDFLRQEGLYEQAHLKVLPSPEARPDVREEENRGLAMVTSAAIQDEKGETAAILFGGELLNRDFRFVDEITELLDVTSTIFLEDLRIATSIRIEGNERPIGTRVSEEVAEVVLDRGNRYLGEAYIIDDWYLTAYEPIRDLRGEVVGMLYVGIPEAPFSAMKHETIRDFLLIATFSTGLAVLLANFIASSIRKPLNKLIEAMRKVEKGDLSQRFSDFNNKSDLEQVKKEASASGSYGNPSPFPENMMQTGSFAGDELQQLGAFFNRMMESLQSKRQRNLQLQEQLQEKERMRSYLLEKVITSQENERKRIARELHDETSQSLTSLMLGLKVVQQTDDIEKVKQLSSELREIIYKTLEEIQRISFELRPSALDDLGLDVAIKRYAKELSQHVGVDIDCDLEKCREVRHNAVVETTVYRVVQEALTNAARHSKAKNLKVWLRCSDEHLEAAVQDDGIGFDFSEEKGKRENLGIFGMQERATLVGGDLIIDSVPGMGTIVKLIIPLNEENS